MIVCRLHRPQIEGKGGVVVGEKKDLLKMDSSAFPRISFFPLPAAEEGKNLERLFLEEEETKVVSPRSRLVIRQLFSTR